MYKSEMLWFAETDSEVREDGDCLEVGDRCWPERAACPVQSGEPENAPGMFAEGGSLHREV